MPTEDLRIALIDEWFWAIASPAYGSQAFIADAEQKDAVEHIRTTCPPLPAAGQEVLGKYLFCLLRPCLHSELGQHKVVKQLCATSSCHKFLPPYGNRAKMPFATNFNLAMENNLRSSWQHHISTFARHLYQSSSIPPSPPPPTTFRSVLIKMPRSAPVGAGSRGNDADDGDDGDGRRTTDDDDDED